MSADTAPAAMPGEEDVARIICRRVHEALFPNAADWRPGELEQKVNIYWPHYAREARAILDLFAPIMAEKEREKAAALGLIEGHSVVISQLESRALAAEAALAAERERCARIAEDPSNGLPHGALANASPQPYGRRSDRGPQPESPGFNFQEIAQKLMATHTGAVMRIFGEELIARGVSADLINEAIDSMEIRMADYRKQFEGANVVQLMIEERKSNGD